MMRVYTASRAVIIYSINFLIWMKYWTCLITRSTKMRNASILFVTE